MVIEYFDQMNITLIFVFTVSLVSCRVTSLDVIGSKYSTGHMGMSGENVFVFNNKNQFYYYERLGYSEGIFEWVNDRSIRLTSKQIGFDIPYRDEKYYRSLNDKIIVF